MNHLLGRCGAVRSSGETTLGGDSELLAIAAAKNAYIKQKQQVSFRFAEMASSPVGGSIFPSYLIPVSRVVLNCRF